MKDDNLWVKFFLGVNWLSFFDYNVINSIVLEDHPLFHNVTYM